MSLSKQLYIILSLIFFMIFTGNFIISVKNTKEYLELESQTKAQDTATSLGMTLKSFMKNKHDSEIVSIINAIADRGFYKEIRLEDVEFTISEHSIFDKLGLNKKSAKITTISLNEKVGKIEKIESNNNLDMQLALLENSNNIEIQSKEETKYRFIPNDTFNSNNINLEINIKKDGQIIKKELMLNVDKVLAKAKREEKFDYIPSWFIKMIPLSMNEKMSEISNGWQTSAIIYVSANAGDAYAKLYEQAKNASIYALISFIIAMTLLAIFLRFILQPLRNIETLAKNIAVGKFETIKELPWTTEIKNVALSMNDMSTKIESVISKLNSNLENMTKKISIDSLTGLSLKQTFETDMKQMFINKSKGYILNIKIDELAHFANEFGNKAVDNFLVKFAQILKNSNDRFKCDITAYRFFGSEFAIIARNISNEDVKNLTEYLKYEFNNLSKEIHKSSIAHIGATPFNPIGTTPEILAASFEAYQNAKQIGPNESYIRDENDLARDMESWRELIFNIINNSTFDVGYINDAYTLGDNPKLVMQEAFTSAKDLDGNAIPIGTFVSIAEQYEKIIDFDKEVVKKVIKHIMTNKISNDISINLSLDSIINNDFKNWLEFTIKQNAYIAKQLVFSITAYGVAKDIKKFKEFVDLVHSSGAKIIIKRFETKFIPLDNIKNFNLDYIRLARDYTSGISKDSGKKGFVGSMQELAELLNIKVFAESVKEEADLNVLKSINIYGASK